MNISSKFWYRLTLTAAAATLACALTPSLRAQDSPPAPTAPPTNGVQNVEPPVAPPNREAIDDNHPNEIRRFDKFMDSHPEISRELAKNPDLINNKQWVESHPALAGYLKNHPGVRGALQEHPHAFMNKEEQLNRHEHQQHQHQNGRPATKP